jgi:hypothetical protein
MKILNLKNNIVLVDDDDFERVSHINWGFNKTLGYIISTSGKNQCYLHRYVLNNPSGIVDHINRNKLDNRKSNLRICTIKENVRNCNLSKNNTSGFRGIAKHHTGKWRAYIMVDRKQIALGLYEYMDDAIGARISAEKEYFGEFAP